MAIGDERVIALAGGDPTGVDPYTPGAHLGLLLAGVGHDRPRARWATTFLLARHSAATTPPSPPQHPPVARPIRADRTATVAGAVPGIIKLPVLAPSGERDAMADLRVLDRAS